MRSLILAVNTAEDVHELSLMEQDGLEISCLGEQRWEGARKEVETLSTRLMELLETSGVDKQDIKKIMLVKGPGSFSALRTGVAFGNALAEGLGAELYELTTFEVLARKAATKDPLVVILPAGGLDAGVYEAGTLKVGGMSQILAKLPHDPSRVVIQALGESLRDELTSIVREKGWKQLASHELQTLGESFETLGMEGCTRVNTGLFVEPLYLKGPKITLSNDPWKQPKN